MDEILKFTEINKLKEIYRANSVGNRKESTAEHTWSSSVLADYFQSQINQKLNMQKVHELLRYHDLVEIDSDDTPLLSEHSLEEKINKEAKAAVTLRSKLPHYISDMFYNSFQEFEAQNTIESKYANAIDKLDPILHELPYKNDWKGFSREFLIEKKLKYFEEFSPIKKVFFECLDYMESNGYFD